MEGDIPPKYGLKNGTVLTYLHFRIREIPIEIFGKTDDI
jgi:hypothetical protein